MINVAQAVVFGRQKALNTFIGGVSDTINTASLLATKLGISSSNIKRFRVVGSNIECFINVTYDILNNAFQYNTSLTYYRDDGGKVLNIGTNSFSFCSNLSVINFPKCLAVSTGFGYSAFRDCPLLVNVSFPECTFLGTQSFYNCTGLKNAVFPKVTSTAVNVFQVCSAIEIINIPKCTNLGGTSGNNSVFLSIKLGCVITTNVALQTINAGAPDGDLVYASGTRGATIIYVP